MVIGLGRVRREQGRRKSKYGGSVGKSECRGLVLGLPYL